MGDVRAAVQAALKVTKPGHELDTSDAVNPWAKADSYLDRVVRRCVNSLQVKSKRSASYLLSKSQ